MDGVVHTARTGMKTNRPDGAALFSPMSCITLHQVCHSSSAVSVLFCCLFPRHMNRHCGVILFSPPQARGTDRFHW